MDRRDFLGTGASAGTALALGGLVGVQPFMQPACNTQTAFDAAKTVIRALQDTLPFFQQLPNAERFVAKVNSAIEIANQFITAFTNKDTSTAVKLAESLISAFQEIATNTKLFPIPTQVTVLAILGIANIALHIIVDFADANATKAQRGAVSASSVNALTQFKNEEVWGKKLNK